jgi:hypothetical protein
MRVGGNLVTYFIELLFRLGTLGGRALSLSKTQKTHWNFFLPSRTTSRRPLSSLSPEQDEKQMVIQFHTKRENSESRFTYSRGVDRI